MEFAKSTSTPLCTRCGHGEFQYFCTCDSQALLCQPCAQTHFVALLGVNHFLLPSQSYGPHLKQGFCERLIGRINAKEKGVVEIMKNVKIIEDCQVDLKKRIEDLIRKLRDFCQKSTSQLDTIKEQLKAEVAESVQELTTSIYTDQEPVNKSLSKWLWDYRQGSIQLFRYSLSLAPVTNALDSILQFERLSIDSDQKSTDNLPSPIDPSDSTDELVSGYFCPLCRQNLKHKYHLKEHFNLHIKEYLYKCPLCESFFMKKNLFKAHIQNNHPEESVRKIMLKSQEFEPKCSQALDLTCLLCNTAIKSKESLYEHAELHSEKYPCPLCSCTEVEFKLMEGHIKRHLKDTRANFQCTICPCKYKNLATIKKHIDAAHQGISIEAGFREVQLTTMGLVCQFCGDAMTTVQLLLRHSEDHSRLGMEMRKRIKCIEEEESKSESEDVEG